MSHAHSNTTSHDQPWAQTTMVSPLRIEKMDATTRQCLRSYLQARLISYHEDEHGQPAFPPGAAPPPARQASATKHDAARRPARGLVTLRSSPGAPEHSGVKALCALSGKGDLSLFGGPDFETVLITMPMNRVVVSVCGDAEHGCVFALSCVGAQGEARADVPSVFCFVKDQAARDKWVDIFRRRHVAVGSLANVPCPAL
jgi:hypothetical protein